MNSFRLLPLLTGVLAASALFAQPAPPKAAAPPVPPAPPRAPMREPMPFLGVVTIPASGALAEQLGLPPGFGLVVEDVVPDSPAAAAGLKRFDVLKAAGDQKLVSPDQLAALVRASKDGEEMTLTLLRRGKEEKATAKLTKRIPEPGRPGDRRFRLRDLLGGAMAEDVLIESGPGEAMRKRVIVRPGRDGEARVTTRTLESGRLQYKDDKGEIDLEFRDGRQTLTAKKPDGTVVFQGPINTDEERKKVPAEWMERVQKLERERATRDGKPGAANEIDLLLDESGEDLLPPIPGSTAARS